jgi:predicted ATP-dependent protease
VLIPRANMKHLMLRQDVVEAVEGGQFGVFAVEHVDQALGILTGKDAGAADAEGRFPADSVNGRVRERLRDLAERRRSFGKEKNGDADSG